MQIPLETMKNSSMTKLCVAPAMAESTQRFFPLTFHVINWICINIQLHSRTRAYARTYRYQVVLIAQIRLTLSFLLAIRPYRPSFLIDSIQ